MVEDREVKKHLFGELDRCCQRREPDGGQPLQPLILRLIVEHEQGGAKRAAYGEAVLDDLSRRLTRIFLRDEGGRRPVLWLVVYR